MNKGTPPLKSSQEKRDVSKLWDEHPWVAGENVLDHLKPRGILKGKKNLRLTWQGFCFSAVSCMAFAGAKRSRWHQTKRKKPKRSPSHHLCLPQLVHWPRTNGRDKLWRMPWLTVLCTIPDHCLLCCEIMHVLEGKQQTIVLCKSCS